jgi:N-methylhydantoinase A
VPVIDMIEIGAGGGSIARVNRLGLLQVGPDSSSAVPGPACYGQGGTDATVTDADLVLGYLAPDSFLGGDMALHVDAARAAIEATIARPLGLSVVEAAWGIHDTVNESMSQAAGIHVLEKGLRSEDFVMTPIGGAGPVHACHVARKMGMRQVVCPAGAGVASAFGFLAAPTSFEFVQSSMEPLDTLDLTAAKALLDDLTARGHALLQDSGLDRSVFSVRLGCAMRYVGQGYEVNVALPDALFAAGDKAALLRAFETAYNALYGRTEAGFRTEIVSWRVVVASPLQEPPLPVAQDAGTDITVALKGHRDVFDGTTMGFVSTPVYDRYRLGEGMRARGPLVVEERESTFVVPAGSEMAVDGHGNLIVTFDAAPE